MMRILVSLLLLFLWCSISFSQDPSPTPPSDDVVKITTTLVQIDVTVTDSKGKIVSDLKAEDFEIFENGQKQEISNFSFFSSVRETVEPVKSIDKIAVPVPPVEIRSDQIRRTIALVVDDLSLSFESAYYVRRSLKKYVDEQMRDGDLVAIIRTSAGIGALQQFTSNKAQLYAAIDKVKWYPLGRGNIGAFAPIEPTTNETLRAAGDDTISDEDIENEKKFLTGFDDFRNASFAVGTLGALRFVVSAMGELPGRKSVILFSDGIRLFPRDTQGTTDNYQVFDFMRQLVDLANRASVVFYTVDARGLQTTGINAQDQIVSPSADSIRNAISSRSRELFDTQEGLVFLARETGGMAVVNNNDLSEGVKRVLDDQSYYLIGYQPDDDTFDKQKRKFNKLDVRVKRPGVKVRYRSGFINVASEETPKATTAETPVQAIQKALVSPFAVNDISLRLNTLFGFDEKQGTYVRSLLHVKADDLKFTDEPNGVKKAVFDVLAVSFGDNGQPVDQISKTYTLRTNALGYEKIQRDGFVYHFTFPVKKPGAYQFRIAIRDSQANKVGSASQFIEVPNLKKNRLTISGIVLENFTVEQWKSFVNGQPDAKLGTTDPMDDTSTRRFKRGSVLRYGFEIYNARLDGAKRPNLTTQIRVFRDRKLVLDGKQIPLDLGGQSDFARAKSVGAISLAGKIEAGDYVLQIIVFDNLATEKVKIATQFVQFEVTE
ncbi:MAG: VWA domain-containing protein [Acidobacteria bacterium]|nr:VWA domain-containing protein [Acidobacteriota bacterium]